MSPAEVAVEFYKSAFPAFARHFYVRTLGRSALAESLDVLVAPDGKNLWAATVGEHRGVYTRLEMTGQRLTKSSASTSLASTAMCCGRARARPTGC